MASIFPFNPLPSTPSSTSQASMPPNYTVSVHDHVLPPGWQCKFDPKSSKYYFIHDYGAQVSTQTLSQPWETFLKPAHSQSHASQGSCHSSRSSSPSHTSYGGRFFQPFSSRYKANDAVVQRIRSMFPETDESHINQLLRIHLNKENAVISALLAETQSKATPLSIADESLFYKLRSYFPTVESETIRQMLVKHGNSEHDVIAAIVSGLGPNAARYQSTSIIGSPKMKLRYLKLIYPDSDEAVLFDLLYNCDHNAQEAIDRLEKMGYRRKDVIRPCSAKVETLSAPSRALRPLSAPFVTRFPPNVADKQIIFRRLAESFPKADRTLINMALECGGFSEERARLFLAAMTPQDSDKYLPRDFVAPGSPMPLRSCRGTQTNALIETISGTPIRTRRAPRPGLKISHMGTWTREDGVLEEDKKKPLAKGANPANRKGPSILNIIKSYLPWRGADPRNKRGADPSNARGADASLRTGPMGAKGADPKLRKGPNRMLRLLKKSTS